MSAVTVPRPSLVSRVPGAGVMLVALAVAFTLGNPSFATPANIANIVMQSSVLLLVALPMTLVIMTEGLDLSVGAVVTLASLVLAMVAVATGSVALAILTGLAVGLACGIVNGVLIGRLALPPFVATLGTLGIVQGLALVLSGGQSVTGVPSGLTGIYNGTLVGIPAPIVVVICAYAMIHLLLYRTAFGTYVFALGGNREALAFAGIPDRFMLAAVYAFNGLMAGVAGIVLTARLSAGHPTAGLGLEFDAIAAVAVGGTSFERGNGWLPGTVLGVITIGVLRNGLNLLAVPSSLQVSCVGLLVILAFVIESLKGEPS